MNKQKFIDYLRSSESLTEGQLEDLNKSLTDFPYFSIGRCIAAKASKELSHDSENALTASAAIYSTDRKHLKKYINGELIFLAKVPTVTEEVNKNGEKSEQENTAVPSLQSIANDNKKEPLSQPPSDKVDSPSTDAHTTEKDTKITTPPEAPWKVVPESDLNFDNLKAPSGEEVDQMLDELQHDMDELKKSREHFADIQNQIEEEEAVSAALRRATEKVQDSVAEVKESKSSGSESIEKAPKAKVEKTESETKVVEEPLSKQTASAKSSSRAFLEFGRSGTSTSVSKVSPSKRKIKSSGSKSSTKAVKPASKSTGGTEKGRKDDDESGGTDQLIDKFIKESPSIKRRTESDNMSDLSKNSTSWDPDTASEYLAQIYLDQGNPRRAITIYEALSLKFPEKKSYFAGLIQEIKK